MDGKKHEQKKEGERDKNSFGQFALIFIAVFAAAFFFFAYLGTQGEVFLGGVKFKAGGSAPSDALKSALGAKSEVVLSADFRGVENVSCTSEMLTQVALGLGASNKTVSIEGKTGETDCVDRNDAISVCRQADVEIMHGECDCVKIEGSAVKIEGSDSFLCENAGRMGQILAASLGGTRVTRETAQQILEGYNPAQANETQPG